MAAPERPGTDSGEAAAGRRALEILAFAFVFPVATYAGFWIGRWVGTALGAPVVGSILGGCCGAAAGFWELLRAVRRAT